MRIQKLCQTLHSIFVRAQHKDRTLGQIPDSDCDSVCLVDGNLLPSIMDELFRDLFIKTVDHSTNLQYIYCNMIEDTATTFWPTRFWRRVEK